MITSTKNPRVAAATKLKKRAFRDREERFLVEGSQVTVEALEAGRLETLFHLPGEHGRVEPIVERARDAGIELQEVSQQVIEHLTSTVTPQGMVGVARFVDVPLAEVAAAPRLVPVLCSVRDPGNAGTILRSADAAEADAIVFAGESVDPYNPKTVRASAGSVFHLPLIRGAKVEDAVAALRDRGAQVLAADSQGEESIYAADLSLPTAVLFGNEAWGLPAEVRALADRTVRVPIRGSTDSLNLAAAAAVVLFESVRAREAPAGAGEEALAEISALIGAAGHDIRSPLTALTGFVGTLAKGWDRFPEEQRREIVEGMLLDGQRVNALVRLVVDAVRIMTGVTLTATHERSDAGDAARWVADLFARSGDFPDIEVEGGAEAGADADRLRALILALAEGAMWWATEGPIRVGIREEAGAAVLEVGRAGAGPDPEQLREMFAGPEHGGKVGLYAAKLIAERLGGSLEAEGGDGVRFTLRLP